MSVSIKSPVSIPRSGFCLFGPKDRLPTRKGKDSFNPSVGILSVWTFSGDGRFSKVFRFQSLGRDSVCLDSRLAHRDAAGPAVSIPRSGFCLFGRRASSLYQHCNGRFNPSVGILSVWTNACSNCCLVNVSVSIPRSGFCLFGP